MADKERELVDVTVLARHEPICFNTHITGCKACSWQPYDFSNTDWLQFVTHLPKFGATGVLSLSREDADWLKKQNISEHD